MLGDVVAEVAAVHDVDDKIEVFAVLERIVHVHKEAAVVSGGADLRVLELLEELLFVHDRVDTAFRNNSSLLNFLHRVEFALFLLLCSIFTICQNPTLNRIQMLHPQLSFF